jgi:hypothetical protein
MATDGARFNHPSIQLPPLSFAGFCPPFGLSNAGFLRINMVIYRNRGSLLRNQAKLG